VCDALSGTGRAVAFLPFFGRREAFGNVRYIFASARFWNPALNGCSGFTPASSCAHVDA
jgi:hypothetical protein